MPPEAGGGADVVGLRRAELGEVRDREDVRLGVGDEALDLRRRDEAALEELQSVPQRADPGRPGLARDARGAVHVRVSLARRPRAQRRRVGVGGLEVAQVVGCRSGAARRARPSPPGP